MIAFIFPGQGSQKVGMGKALADTFPEPRAAFDEADAALGESLSRLCFDGPEDQLKLTENTQPAILTMSIAATRVLAASGIEPAFVAGHSLGEYSANVAAGTMAFADAVRMVRRRGRYMQEAVPVGHGADGGDSRPRRRGGPQGVRGSGAGRGGQPGQPQRAGQVVIAGARGGGAARRRTRQGARRQARDSAAGERAVPLRADEAGRGSAGARAARAGRDRSARSRWSPTSTPSRSVTRGAAIEALVRQVSSPVRWEDVVRRLASEGVTTYVEVGPGTVLSGLVRKIHKDAHGPQLRRAPATWRRSRRRRLRASACSISPEKLRS